MKPDTESSKWRKDLDRLVDEVVADMPEQERRAFKERDRQISAAPKEARTYTDVVPDRLTFRGRKEHKKCRIDYATGEISCTNHPLHGKHPPRDRHDYLDCRQRWCPWFAGMDRERKHLAKHHAKLQGKEGVISLYNLDTAD